MKSVCLLFEGKGVLGPRETQGALEEGEKVSTPPSSRAPVFSRPKPPFPSFSNACHAGYHHHSYLSVKLSEDFNREDVIASTTSRAKYILSVIWR